jgi:hypothetical protein
MPLQFGATGYLTPRQIAQIKQWIELGAPFDHVPDSGAGPGDAASREGSAPSAPDSQAGDAAHGDAAPKDASVESG